MNDSVRDGPFSFSCVCVCVFVRDREQLSLYESVELALCPSNPLLSLLSWRVLAMIWAFKVKEKPRPNRHDQILLLSAAVGPVQVAGEGEPSAPTAQDGARTRRRDAAGSAPTDSYSCARDAEYCGSFCAYQK